ncbi:MAG: nucleotide exchange factor GrpE [Dehalococcoidia bacterium]
MEDEKEGGFVDRRASSKMGSGSEAASGRTEEAASGESVAPAEGLEKLRAELERERQKADENLRQWQRAAADYQNLKRRSEQERSEATVFAQVALVINLLPVYDDLDRALATVDANLAGLNWVQGISAIQRKFAATLEAMDVHEIESEGAKFDPSEHEAVGQTAGEEGIILHVVQKGYRLGSRVVRPAMVIVGNGEEPPGDSPAED